MSSDNFHLVVQHKDGYWQVKCLTMTDWKKATARAEYKTAKKLAKESFEFDTLDRSLEWCASQDRTEYGEVVINYEEYYA